MTGYENAYFEGLNTAETVSKVRDFLGSRGLTRVSHDNQGYELYHSKTSAAAIFFSIHGGAITVSIGTLEADLINDFGMEVRMSRGKEE
jgi:hypothetical protein